MSQTAAELDEIIEAITVDCYGDDEELGAFLQAFEDELELPMNALVVGVPIEVVAMEYGGDVRRGIVVHCRREGEDYEVSLADVVLAEPASASALHAAFRRWLGCELARLPATGAVTNEEQRRNALRSLNGAERAAVLDALLREHPELQDRADRLAAERLELVDRDVVAETVSMALESIPPEEVGNRSGRQRGLGYVEPTQAVWDLLEETVQPHLQDIVRRADLGMTDAALDLGLGVIARLYECRLAGDDGSVLAWGAGRRGDAGAGGGGDVHPGNGGSHRARRGAQEAVPGVGPRLTIPEFIPES